MEVMQLGTLFDAATFSTGYESSSATISGIIADAFVQLLELVNKKFMSRLPPMLFTPEQIILAAH